MNHYRAPPAFLFLGLFLAPVLFSPHIASAQDNVQDDVALNDQILAELNLTSSKRGEPPDQLREIAAIAKLVTSQQQETTELKQLTAAQQKQIEAQQNEIANLKLAGQGSHASNPVSQNRATP